MSRAGGVSFNIARALQRLLFAESSLYSSQNKERICVRIISAVGNDSAGFEILEGCKKEGIDSSMVVEVDGRSTDTVVVLLDENGDVSASVARVNVVENFVTLDIVMSSLERVNPGDLVVVDGDVSKEVVEGTCRLASRQGCTVLFEPASTSKATKIVNVLDCVHYITPNISELVQIATSLKSHASHCIQSENLDIWFESQHVPNVWRNMQPLVQLILEHGTRCIVVTGGGHGAAMYRLREELQDSTELGGDSVHVLQRPKIQVLYCPARTTNTIISTSGAGDCLVAGMVLSIIKGQEDPMILATGMASAAECLLTEDNVPREFSRTSLQDAQSEFCQNSNMYFFPSTCCCSQCVQRSIIAISQ